ncbi:hypothetical protein MSAN_00356900 [Mycena sanguinolenta]|uniref:G domain-containing protein n=1 Tax=Mycena sanguinolenta TaxID=230812 RepID=A0A8H6ZD51_9AGAR|nr:hypothetical protein MSAN_00356900 [Mycena sanguinolenta]
MAQAPASNKREYPPLSRDHAKTIIGPVGNCTCSICSRNGSHAHSLADKWLIGGNNHELASGEDCKCRICIRNSLPQSIADSLDAKSDKELAAMLSRILPHLGALAPQAKADFDTNIRDAQTKDESEDLASVWSSDSMREAVPEEDEVTVAVMGPTGSGKTTFINLLSASNLRVGKSLESCTNTVQVALPFELDERSVMLIDTPGFDDTTRSDTDILTQIATFLATAYASGKKLAGVIYMHRISDVRMGGISTRNFKMFRQLCGESTLRNVVIVTNMWSQVTPDVGEARERELASDERFFKPVLDKGAQMLRNQNDVPSAQAIIRYLIGNQPKALRIQRELVDEGKDIGQTAAGAELNRELAAQIERHKAEMVQLQQELQEAIRAKDEETKKELEIETRKLQAEMTRVQNDSKKLASEYTKQRLELEKQMNVIAEAGKRDAERAQEKHLREMQALVDAVRETRASDEKEKEDIKRQLRELQQQYEEMTRKKKNKGSGFRFLAQLAQLIAAIVITTN